MQHLRLEDLARLVDEEPSPSEAGHLAVCAHCAADLSGLSEQTATLEGLTDPRAPGHLWSGIANSVSAEGIAEPKRVVDGTLLRWAAGIILFLLGAGSGTFLIAPRMASVSYVLEQAPVSPADPASALELAERQYLEAVARFATASETGDGVDPFSRLAALEGIVLTTSAALREAPADPVINSYHLTALAQKEALLQELRIMASVDDWF